MRLIYFGSGEFGLPTLQMLLDSNHEVAAVVSQPDRMAGRGGRVTPTPVSRFAREQGLPVLTPEKPNSAQFVQQMADMRPDLAVIVAYGHLIRPDLLAVPARGFVNLHASLLPAYRGAAPVPWAIYNQESVSGVSIFLLDSRFDTGAVLATASVPIESTDTARIYLDKLAPVGAELMAQVVEALQAGAAVPVPQDENRASRAPKLKKTDGEIDWNRTFGQIDAQVRAFQPWPKAYTVVATAKGPVRINLESVARGMDNGTARPGTVLSADPRSGLVIMGGDGPVRLVRLQAEGKRSMTDTELLRGTKISL